MDFEKIGKFIATLRKDKNLTQLQLAELVDASDKTISKWEHGSFPDIVYQSKLCKALDIELDELHAGELNLKRRRKRKIRKLMNRLVVIYAAITIPLIIFLCFFFVHNYDSTKIYRIDTLDDSVKAVVRGMLIETNQTHLLYVGNINLWDYNVKDTDIISVDIYSGKNSIFHSNKLEDIIVKYDEEKEIDRNNLSIKVLVSEKDKTKHSYEISLKSVDISSSDNKIKTPKISELELLSDEQIIKNLKEAGFKQNQSDWYKIIKKKTKEETITYVSLVNKLSYSSSDDTIIQNITFYTNTKHLEVYIYHRNKEDNVLFEKYIYNYANENLDCQVGVCSTLEKVLKTMDSYISLLIGES